MGEIKRFVKIASRAKVYTHCYYKSIHSELVQIGDIPIKVHQLLKTPHFQFPHIRRPAHQAGIELDAPICIWESARCHPSTLRIHLAHPLEMNSARPGQCAPKILHTQKTHYDLDL